MPNPIPRQSRCFLQKKREPCFSHHSLRKIDHVVVVCDFEPLPWCFSVAVARLASVRPVHPLKRYQLLRSWRRRRGPEKWHRVMSHVTCPRAESMWAFLKIGVPSRWLASYDPCLTELLINPHVKLGATRFARHEWLFAPREDVGHRHWPSKGRHTWHWWHGHRHGWHRHSLSGGGWGGGVGGGGGMSHVI